MSFTIHTKDTAPSASVPYMAGYEDYVGFIPNLIGVMAESPAALASTTAMNQAIEKSTLSPIEIRIVTVTVSAENNCSYCVPAQSTLAKIAEMPDEILTQVRAKQALSDQRLEALRVFTNTVLANKGWVSEKDVQVFIDAGYDRKNVLEVVTLIALMTLTNYVGHMASLPLDDAFMPQQWVSEARKTA